MALERPFIRGSNLPINPELLPQGPVNLFARFISPNPITSVNPVQRFPSIHPNAFLSPFSTVIGDVIICDNVFVAPSATLRADEGTPFFMARVPIFKTE
ncbi:hypothetical protein [Paenibacillus sp. YAF4_2]|uniref:hypothetical protein n=1 Tax=Paenibacillus sp. YAF4_2 TaxID=3233085 RepID=UPI003F9A47A7